MDDLRALGAIVRLQIQKERMVIGVRPERIYRLDPLVGVERIAVSADGAMARLEGGWVLDVHHAAHPGNPAADPGRVISMGFTSHYAAMAAHFGDARVGDAGENIVVDTEHMVTLGDVTGGIVIKRPDTTIELTGVTVAEPCVPFTRFRMHQQEASLDDVKAHRDFLRDGMRGFVMGVSVFEGAAEIAVGDEVLVRS